MAWLNHKSDDCKLGKKCAAEQQGSWESPSTDASADANTATHSPDLANLASMQEK